MPKSKLSLQEMKEANALAMKVKQLRIANHLTQSDVAKALNVSPGFISNVEQGRTAMSLRLLIYYARLTGTTLDMLVGDMIPEYKADALDHALTEATKDLTHIQKEKVLKIIEIIKE
ncbi:MAG: helix-turn-helix transcriptional regulator [Acutalibacteraceae bacterium]|nr:helix-turn-helix transcriptional regulator [Acutalibacteraceae bacterium]